MRVTPNTYLELDHQNARAQALMRYGRSCPCGEKDPRKLILHHLEVDGGDKRSMYKNYDPGLWGKKRNWPENLQTVCRCCHNAIHARIK